MGSWRINDEFLRRLDRRHALRAAALGASGIALWSVGCGGSNNNTSNNKAATATKAATVATSVAPVTTARPGTPAPAATGGASATAVRTASPAAAAPSGTAPAVAQFGYTNNPPNLTATPKKGGTFRYATHVTPPTLDPVKSASYESANIYTPVYNRLLRAQYGGEMKPYNPWSLGDLVGDLAESWSQPDPMTYTFKLRQNVKWQNVDPVKGRAFTADDVKYTFEQGFLKNPETAAQLPFTVTTPDQQTVQLKLTKPANYVPMALMDPRFVMLPHEVAEADGDFSKRAIGTGPFIMDDFQPNTKAHYKRNPDYYRPDRPYFDAMQFDNLKDNAAYKAAVIAGQYDWWEYGFPTPDDLKDLLAARKDTVVLKLQSRWQSNVFHFGFPADKDPWKDPRVRAAVSKGFDRSVYGKQVYGGDYNVLGAYAWINFFDSAPDLGDAYKFDPQVAKQMLSAAGQPSLSFTLDFFPYGGDAAQQLQSIQEQLKAVGINMTLNQMDAVAFITKYYGQKADNPVIGFIPTPPRWAPLSMLVLWHSGSPKNYLRLTDADLDATIDKVSTVLDPAELKKAYQDVWLKLHQPVHFFTFPEAPTNHAHSPKLHGNLPNQYNDNAGWGNQAMEDFWLDT